MNSSQLFRSCVYAVALFGVPAVNAEVKVYLHSQSFASGPSTIYQYSSTQPVWMAIGSASTVQRSTQFASDILGNVFTYNSSSRRVERLVGGTFQDIGGPSGFVSGGGYNLEVTNSGKFLLTRYGSSTLYSLNAGATSWQTSGLGFSANLTGDYDPLTNRYVVGRVFAKQFREINPDSGFAGNYSSYAGNTNEWRRMGSIVDGYLVENTSTQGIRRWNMNSLPSVSSVLSQTGGDWLASGVDRVNQTLYTYDYNGGTFGIKNVNTGQFTLLASGPNMNLSSIVVVNTDVEINGIITQSRYDHTIDSLSIGGTNGAGILDIVNGTTLTVNGNTTINSGSTLNVESGSGISTPSIANNGTLSINDGVVSANISGAGSIQKVGSGTATLTGTSSGFTGNYDVQNGTLTGNATAFANANSVAIATNAMVDIDHGGSATVGAEFSGSGTLRKLGAGSVTLTGDSSGFAGDVSVLSGTLNIGAGGVMNAASTSIAAAGTLNVNGGSFTTGSFDNSLGGDFNLSDGTFTVNGTFTPGTNFSQTGGTLEVATISGDYGFDGGLLDVVTMNGNLTQTGGTLAPGDSPGITTINGDYFLNGGSLDMELGGLLQGTEYDYLDINGDWFLNGGTLNVLAFNGYAPTLGATYDLFDFNSIQGLGVFDAINLPTLSSDLRWNTSNLYSLGQLSVSAVPEPSSFVGLAMLTGGMIFRRQRRRRS